MTPNQSPEPTTVGACRSAVAVHVASRRWLQLFSLGVINPKMNYKVIFDITHAEFQQWLGLYIGIAGIILAVGFTLLYTEAAFVGSFPTRYLRWFSHVILARSPCLGSFTATGTI